MRTLQNKDIQQFIRDGYVMLPGAFEREVALRLQPMVLAAGGFNPDGSGPWEKSHIVVPKDLVDPPAGQLHTQRVSGAFDDLLGKGRWKPHRGSGYGLVSPEGLHSGPWAIPTDGWHIDGLHFRHRLGSPEQGLLCVALLTDVGPTGGATAIRPGSHRVAARLLDQAEPEGLEQKDLSMATVSATADWPWAVMHGRAGDMAILHPMMVHTATPNADNRLRLATNLCISLHEPLRLGPDRADNPTALEQSIVQAVAA